MTARAILARKGAEVVTIGPSEPVFGAIEQLNTNRIGALVVVDEQKEMVGIITERDILQANAHHFDQMANLTVGDIMTTDVVTGDINDNLDYLHFLMCEKKIRHLPILCEGRLAGLLSTVDLVKERCRQAEDQERILTRYISGRYPAV
ncbi:MAG: CBS domain-containing protein [Bradymonadales bacterium]|nr:CBS domain-containing protein [Bradymonadales bacterium]